MKHNDKNMTDSEKAVQKKFARALKAIEAAINSAKTENGRYRIEEIHLCSEGYAEPGYDGNVVALGNWNELREYDNQNNTCKTIDNTPSRLAAVLEKIGVEIEWEDEWNVCCECGRLVRKEPDSYSWQRSYVESDEGAVCMECLDPEDHLVDLEGQEDRANTIRKINPAKYGYILLKDDYESGWHRGQDASPKKIAEVLRNKFGVERFLFNVDNVGQFDMSFSVYVHESEIHLVDKEKFMGEDTDGPSNSEALKRGLQQASVEIAKLEGEGIKYAEISGDKVEARLISPEDFVEKGIKK